MLDKYVPYKLFILLGCINVKLAFTKDAGNHTPITS